MCISGGTEVTHLPLKIVTNVKKCMDGTKYTVKFITALGLSVICGTVPGVQQILHSVKVEGIQMKAPRSYFPLLTLSSYMNHLTWECSHLAFPIWLLESGPGWDESHLEKSVSLSRCRSSQGLNQ